MAWFRLPVRRDFLIVLGLVLASILSAFQLGAVKIRWTERKPQPKAEAVKLPPPRLKGEVSVEEAIARRRSRREYRDEPLELWEVSQLLWASQGITKPSVGFRAAPSAGATYPLELYLVSGENGVRGLKAGIYHYNPKEHSLTLVRSGDFSREIYEAAVRQEWVLKAPIRIVICAVFERTTSRYGDRGVRYVYMEAGHVGENIYLQAEALGLSTVAIGAFYDDEVRRILGAPENHKPVYIYPVGRRV